MNQKATSIHKMQELARQAVREIAINQKSEVMIHYDTSPVEGTRKKDLNMDLIRDYYLGYNMFDLYEETEKSLERILINADILKEVSGALECTVGGLIIFGKKRKGICLKVESASHILQEMMDLQC